MTLTGLHDVAGFDCGVSSLNAWLVEQALRAQQAGAARTFVWITAHAPQQVADRYSSMP